ncbi:MAG: hypothetical protein COV52_02560 [Gammaproteobacteria bacterium CG11_big_fil_rev_8_21_14_0_20_46_22]|nr:MAG: hypothetical protein COW05_08600 [Gammaproteobacteria bacterium CG12_big_fil_rev_8_21_14_0_65_46_12]PIR11662.1 MAG: hypothetical protein COV52_02560 [Gammaproteobacteria bacterium CG11_big_fil_rev_8_21_14_0_20_46_22]
MRFLMSSAMMALTCVALAAPHYSQSRLNAFQSELNDAANQPAESTQSMLASKAVEVQDAQVFSASAGQDTKVIMRFVNRDEHGHAVQAVYSPLAKQAQLQTAVQINGKLVNVQVHSFALQLNSTTWLGQKQKHVELMNLSQSLTPGQTVPLVIIYRDGSYDAFDAKVVSSS